MATMIKINLILFPFLAAETLLSNDVAHVIQIHTNPSTTDLEIFSKLPSISMTTENGKLFTCYMPTTQEATNLYSDLLSFGRMNIKQLKQCYDWFQDPWNYEICPGTMVRRVQQQQDQIQTIEPLGEYSGDIKQEVFDYTSIEPIQYQEIIQQLKQKQPLYTERYGDAVQVQYTCGKEEAIVGYGENIDQSQRMFLIVSPLFCQHTETMEVNDEMLMQSLFQPLLQEKVCIRRNEGWWTYEFCFGESIKQYHKEQSGKITIEYVLGTFDTELNEALETSKNAIIKDYLDGIHEEEARLAYIQEYSRGTICDENGQHRSTQVYFYCNSNSKSHFIISVREHKTCSYIMKIATPVICQHPRFYAEHSHQKELTQSIHCLPQL